VTTLFGREREASRLDEALSQARAGSGSLVLLTGEPGIGKSSLGREAAIRASAAGMRVLSGRCWEGGGAAPYWPWIQIFRDLGATPFEALVRDEGGDSQQKRFQLFDAAARVLTGAAVQQPTVVFLDDLHAADLPSLLLLLFLSRQVSAWPLFVLGASRELEVRLSPPVADALAKIGREGEVLSIRRLIRDDVAAWVSTSQGRVSSADDVFRVTEGNPLFVREMIRLGARGAHRSTSDGMKATLDEHLGKLSQETRAVLEAAAVLGRDFGSRELAEITASQHDIVQEQMRHGIELGVLEAIERERFQFTHVLLRDRLYDALATSPRSELHWAAGLFARTHGADPTQVANHLLEGVGAGDQVLAAGSALAAAQKALSALAFEAAADIAERGLLLLASEPSPLACALEIACGEGLIRSGAMEAGHARCVRAAGMARDLGLQHEQAHAALVYGAELTGSSTVDPVMVDLLEGAISAVGAGDSPLAAKLGARLATALRPPRSEAGANRIGDFARASVAMARRLGDAETLLYVLEFARGGLAFIGTSDETFELTREAVTLAQLLEHRMTLLKLGPSYAGALLERGFRAEADAVLTAMVALHEALDYPQSRWRLPMLRAGFCLFEGRLDEAQELGDVALALAEPAGAHAAVLEWAILCIAIAIARREPTSIGPYASRLLAIFERNRLAGHHAWVLGAIGRRDEAIRRLRETAGVEQGFFTLMLAAEACILLEDAEAAPRIAAQLERRSLGSPFLWGYAAGYAIGPTPRVLGELARILGRRDEALRLGEEARALCARIGAKPFGELSLGALARLGSDATAGRRDDGEAASPKQSSPIGHSPRVQSKRPGSRDLSLRREGDVWAVEGSAAPPFRLKHSKGLSYLSELLAHPDQEVHVLTLIGLDHGAGDAGPVLDARAKADYKERLSALEEEISEAEAFADPGRVNRAREEIEILATQLAGAVGLGGRDRRAASDAERARINVQRRLKDAIESIGRQDPDLGRYLLASVKTGTYCSFTPL
jgi:hypothetical protein